MTSADASTFQLPEQLTGIDPSALVLLLDCDGVLAPIVDDPAAAEVPQALLELVRDATERCALTGVITGRGLERAREMVPVPEAWFATLHGVEITPPGGATDVDPVSSAAREHVEVAATLAQTVGWAYEDKGGSVTIHFRQRGNLGQHVDPVHVKAQLQTVLNPLKVEIHDAKQVLEVKPKGVRTKGDALRILTERAPASATTVVYVGDDLTDLDAFRAVDALRGEDATHTFVKVAVGGDELPPALGEAADVILDDQSHVEALLRALLASE